MWLSLSRIYLVKFKNNNWLDASKKVPSGETSGVLIFCQTSNGRMISVDQSTLYELLSAKVSRRGEERNLHSGCLKGSVRDGGENFFSNYLEHTAWFKECLCCSSCSLCSVYSLT